MIKDTTTINDWFTPVKDLLQRLHDADFKLLRVNNGGDEDENVSHPREEVSTKRALDEILATDDSYLWAEHPDAGEVVLWIVLGNGYCEIVADHSVDAELESVTTAFSEHWEGVGVQTVKQYDCVCDVTGDRFYARHGERTDLCPKELERRKQESRRNIRAAYFELTGSDASDDELRNAYIGTYDLTIEFLRERVALQFEELILKDTGRPRLWTFLSEHLDWGSVEEDYFDPNGYGFEKVDYLGRIYVFDGNV